MYGHSIRRAFVKIGTYCGGEFHGLRFLSYISVLILKSQRHSFSQRNVFSQIIKFVIDCIVVSRSEVFLYFPLMCV